MKLKWILPLAGALGVMITIPVTAISAQESEEGRFPMPPSQMGPQMGGQQRPNPMMMKPMPQMGGGSAAIAVGDGSVFVVSQGQLYKFDQKTLKQLAKVSLLQKKEGSSPEGEPSQRMRRPSDEMGGPGGQGGGGPMGGGPGGGSMGGGMTAGRPGGGPMGSGQMGGPMEGIRMMMRSGEGAAITVADDFIYVVSQGKLFKFSTKNLELQGSADLERRETEKKPSLPRSKKPSE